MSFLMKGTNIIGDVLNQKIETITYEYYIQHQTEIEASGLMYLVEGDIDAELKAHNIEYSNTTSGLIATNVQGAIDEITKFVTVNCSSAITVSEGAISVEYGHGVVCISSPILATYTGATGWVTIANLPPEVPRPKTARYTIAEITSPSHWTSNFQVNPNGTIRMSLRQTFTNGYIFASLTYLY